MATTYSDKYGKQHVESAAVVLDCRDHGESDIIVTFFCRHQGRLTGIAKGAKRSKKRFVNKLEIFSSLIIQHSLPQNNRLAFVAEAELVDGFLGLRKNVACYTTATAICEFILLATKEMEGDEELYPLLIWSFHSLNSGLSPLSVLIFFLIRFFAAIGYSPQLESCLGCGQEVLTNETYSFHSSSGGIRCSRCNEKSTMERVRLSLGTLKSLTTALNQPLERLHRLQLSENSQEEALAFLHSYACQLFQREITSWAFLTS
ncbi:MAG: DNA repair protein RecO [Desulfocapsa sp.]|nr:DNA repair protein RecO [Desulfocapsa sp.]